MTLPESITGGDTGHIGWHEGLHTKYNAIPTKVSGATTLGDDHSIVLVDTGGGAVTITLPDAGDFDHKAFFIQRDGGSVVTVQRGGSDTIDFDGSSVTSVAINSDHGAVGVYPPDGASGTRWKVSGTKGTVA